MTRQLGRRVALVIALALAYAAPLAAQTPTDVGAAEVREKMLDQARAALVKVELFLKLPADDDAANAAAQTFSAQALDRQQEQVARQKKAVQLMGVIVSPREVFVPDTGIDPRRILRWEVTDSSGTRTVARRSAILLDAPGLVLEPIDADAKWPAPTFADAPIDAKATLVAVVPVRPQSDWVLLPMSVPPVAAWEARADAAKDAGPFWFVRAAGSGGGSETSAAAEPPPAAPRLIFSARGELLGAGLTERLHADRATPPWRGADLQAAARITTHEWEKTEARTRDAISPLLYPVRIEYRRPKGGAQAFPDSELLGWAVSERRLLIPVGIHRQIAARIAKITVQLANTDVEAQFVGQLRDLDAMLIELAGDASLLAAHSDLNRPGRLQEYRPHSALTITRKYGSNDLRVDYTRPIGTTLGYDNRSTPSLVPTPTLGSLVLDPDGNPIGIYTRHRRPLEELDLYEQISQAGPRQLLQQLQGFQQTSSVELFTASQLSEAVTHPGDSIDRRVVRRDEKDQDRRCWLGVEFNPLTRELAESLGCRKESKDGTVGLMISQLYAGSPAEQVGLRGGDVLLELELDERPRPIELAPPRGFGGRGAPDFSQLTGGGESPFGSQGQSRAPWPSRGNYLTNLLGIIGEDTQLKLKFWRDGKAQSVEVTIAEAPPDQDSAAQFKDETLGITVKEVTYEVRAALNMKPTDPGVVVAKVESGSPAARARINNFEIVQSADGVPLDSPTKFEAVVKKALDEKKDQIRLAVVDRGRQRFADLKLGQ